MPLPPTTPPLTRAESSAYEATSSHADVMDFIAALQARQDPRLWVGDFGHSPEGRVLPLLVLSAQGHFTPEAAAASGLPVVLVINGIHVGEVEGKEASLMLVRQLLDGTWTEGPPDLLSRLVLVVVPLFNPDGNERLSPDNRPLDLAHLRGQIGPTLVGTRNNAAGINLNRDYMRQQAPEMRQLQQRVCQPWNPHLTIDCHATNGSIHRFAMSYDVPHTLHSGRREPVDYMRQRMMPAVQAAVKAREGLDSFWYGNFLRDEGGEGLGWMTYTHHPRFGSNYRGLTNRLDLLLEAYSYQSFEARVRVTHAFICEALRYMADHAAEVLALLAACQMPPPQVAVRYRLEAFPDETAEILTRAPYTLEGAPITVPVPHYANFVPEALVDRPWGYAVPPAVAQHLVAHGLQLWDGPPAQVGALAVAVATVGQRVSTAGREILEANASSYLEADYQPATRALPEGWALVPTEQPRGAIAVYLCEAGSDDGLVAAGLLDEPAPGSEFPAWRVLQPPV